MRLILASLLIVFSSHNIFAKTIVEPSLSLGMGSISTKIQNATNIPNDTQINASYTTLSGGVRYGITRDYIHVTGIVDGYLVNMGKATQTIDGTATDFAPEDGIKTGSTFKANIGLGIGYEWNIPLRTYVIIGFPFSSAEVSYYWNESMLVGLKYTRMEMDFGGTDLAINNFGVAVSFPIEFDYPSHWWRKKDWE